MDNIIDTTSLYLITEEYKDQRIDLFLAGHRRDLTRSRIQSLVKDGNVTVNGNSIKTSYRLKNGDNVKLSIPPAIPYKLRPEPVDFSVIYEDSSLIVLNKPPGLVTHPSPGHTKGTLVHGLLRHCEDLSGIGGELRPGIVHRLDKDTSGLMVVAKNDISHNHLASQFKDGLINKRYIALAHGSFKEEKGVIDLPISRHPKKRKEMAVVPSRGKNALTLWRIEEEIGDKFSILSVTLKTGRTHQIRVHLSHINHPIVGDPVYGFKKKMVGKSLPGCIGYHPCNWKADASFLLFRFYPS